MGGKGGGEISSDSVGGGGARSAVMTGATRTEMSCCAQYAIASPAEPTTLSMSLTVASEPARVGCCASIVSSTGADAGTRGPQLSSTEHDEAVGASRQAWGAATSSRAGVSSEHSRSRRWNMDTGAGSSWRSRPSGRASGVAEGSAIAAAGGVQAPDGRSIALF